MTTVFGRRTGVLLCLAALATACGDGGGHGDGGHGDGGAAHHGHDHGGDTAAAPVAAADHGARKELGRVDLLGHEFAVALLGELVAGAEGAFEVRLTSGDPGTLRPILWLEDAGGKQVGGPENGTLETGAWHFHVTPRAGASPTRVVLRLRQDERDERAGLPLDGHGHEHPGSPHDGIVARLLGAGGQQVGHVELKLHDDKGDLELWLARDEAFEQPLDVPLDAVPTVTFVDVAGRVVELRVRDRETNADEDGTANIRGGSTNYFIFPGDSGADASWLKGKEFRSIVSVRLKTADGEWASEEFVLKPHTHHGEDH